MRRLTLAVLTAVLLTVPVMAQEGQLGIVNPYESTPTTLFFHIDGIQDFPINTQPPDDRYQDDNAFGSTTQSFSCSPVDIPSTTADELEWHTYYGYSSMGYVEYDFEEQGGPRYHKERGLSFDVQLDSAVNPTLYWYLKTVHTTSDTGSLPADPNDAPTVVPNVVVQATMRQGDDVAAGDEAFNSGTEIAKGRTEPITLAPGAANEMAPGIYEFAVPMAFTGPTDIPKDESYNVRIDVFIENPMCENAPEGGYIMGNQVEIHTSSKYRPRMDLAVMNPLVIDLIHPMFVGDDLVVHTNMNSPWGNYDVDENNIKFDIEGPSQASSLGIFKFDEDEFFHVHNNHHLALEVVYQWPYQDDNAKDGIYYAVLKIYNDQGNAEANGRVAFQIGKADSELPPCDPEAPEEEQTNCAFVNTNSGKGKESPGVGLLATIALLGFAVLRRK